MRKLASGGEGGSTDNIIMYENRGEEMSRITDNNQTVGNSPEATTVCLHERPEYTLATTVYTSDYGTHSHTFQMRMGGGGQAYIWGRQ